MKTRKIYLILVFVALVILICALYLFLSTQHRNSRSTAIWVNLSIKRLHEGDVKYIIIKYKNRYYTIKEKHDLNILLNAAKKIEVVNHETGVGYRDYLYFQLDDNNRLIINGYFEPLASPAIGPFIKSPTFSKDINNVVNNYRIKNKH